MAITIENVRFSYCNLFQPKLSFNNPNGEPKYSTTVLIPKSNTQAKAAIDQAIAATIEAGVTSKWGGVRPPQPAICVHDGDGPRPSDGSPFGEECRGYWVFTASSKQPPFVVDAQVQNIIDPTQVYSGMWGNVNVNFFPYSIAGKKGIGCGLNGVQKTRDDEPLSSHVTAQEAFQPTAPAAPAPAYQQPAYPQYAAPVAPAPTYQPPAAPAYPQAAAPAVGYQMQVDPITGQPIHLTDPVTGRPIQQQVDPVTGQPIQQQGYAPTGMPIAGI